MRVGLSETSKAGYAKCTMEYESRTQQSEERVPLALWLLDGGASGTAYVLEGVASHAIRGVRYTGGARLESPLLGVPLRIALRRDVAERALAAPDIRVVLRSSGPRFERAASAAEVAELSAALAQLARAVGIRDVCVVWRDRFAQVTFGRVPDAAAITLFAVGAEIVSQARGLEVRCVVFDRETMLRPAQGAMYIAS